MFIMMFFLILFTLAVPVVSVFLFHKCVVQLEWLQELLEEWSFRRDMRAARILRKRQIGRRSRQACMQIAMMGDFDDLVAVGQEPYVRSAYKISRVVRGELNRPKFSKANEGCVFDFLTRKRADLAPGMRDADWYRVKSLAVKLSFVKDEDEEVHDSVATRLGHMVDQA
jgi:hypothetical protein